MAASDDERRADDRCGLRRDGIAKNIGKNVHPQEEKNERGSLASLPKLRPDQPAARTMSMPMAMPNSPGMAQ